MTAVEMEMRAKIATKLSADRARGVSNDGSRVFEETGFGCLNFIFESLEPGRDKKISIAGPTLSEFIPNLSRIEQPGTVILRKALSIEVSPGLRVRHFRKVAGLNQAAGRFLSTQSRESRNSGMPGVKGVRKC